MNRSDEVQDNAVLAGNAAEYAEDAEWISFGLIRMDGSMTRKLINQVAAVLMNQPTVENPDGGFTVESFKVWFASLDGAAV